MGLKLKKKMEGQILGWQGRFSWTDHNIIFLLWREEHTPGPLHRHLKTYLPNSVLRVSSLNFFRKLKDDFTGKS